MNVLLRRHRLAPIVEILTVVALLAIAIGSYLFISRHGNPEALLLPTTVAALLVANLVPAMALMVLIARRVAMRRAARSPIGGRGRLHVKLVALFSAIASVPTILVVVFASLLFQSGVEFWFSHRAQTVLASARNASTIYANEHRERILLDVQVMGGDMVEKINEFGLASPSFKGNLLYQTAARQLNESAIVTLDRTGHLHRPVEWNPDHRPLGEAVPKQVLVGLTAGQVYLFQAARDRIEAIVRLDPQAAIYFYGAREVSPDAMTAFANARHAASDYQKTLERARTLQFRFNAILLLVSLLIVAIAIWIALTLADRLVRPVGQLVDAARKVTAGDLSARVPASTAQDEVGTLGSAFNRMTRRLEEQTGALVTANAQLETRRAFIEAVLSGVTAGIISVDKASNIRLMNSSAAALLKTDRETAMGQKLAALAPELADFLDTDEREGIVQLASGGEPRTLAVKRVKTESSFVLTFDDITEQLLDQRRAAWSDVARRIAHEIKNPLTPIQLAAERLQRRYGKEIESDPAVFEQLTGTIVRQVGDLRRMVDEFSSFARMPKPVFREENIVEIARQALFLHEVAHPDIKFTLDAPEPSPILVCDRRQLGQALTNVVKNAVEAIDQKGEEAKARGEGEIAMIVREQGPQLIVEIADTGIGLPAERARLTEPYMTTRAKGTGLGLAIVKKIVEEHFGSIDFEDRPGGGSLVRLLFDKESLNRLATDGADALHDQAVSG
ncbi:MAG TPA: ATP-binding protein [Allosphingosinicella sp.]|jgi:two-component system nitrogen regulation sensor histidine kinase NtrY|nr:ATP-binding protein [Allosphingosinicella sp.]